MLEDWQNAGFGLYLHWPFCQAKCPYCDFNSHVAKNVDQDRWKRAFLSEIDRAGSETGDRILNTVFFGGGTPSLMDPDLVNGIMDRIRTTWRTANDLEVTLEANPTSVEAGRFSGYREAGVNRVSMGIQALNNVDLAKLGRLHTVEEAELAFQTARKIFDRVSFDLIYARQDQSLSEWSRELKAALAMAVDHLSLYQLTIEPGTAFGTRYAAGGLQGLPTDDLGADMYELTQELCSAAGYECYEISNHAKPGQESRHNLIYWRGGDYVGIGPGAHGRLTLNGSRFATRTPLGPDGWLHAVEKKGSGESEREQLLQEDHITELLLMGLRLTEGLPKSRLLDPAFDQMWSNSRALVDEGWIDDKTDHLRVSAKGRPILNAVLRELLSGY